MGVMYTSPLEMNICRISKNLRVDENSYVSFDGFLIENPFALCRKEGA